MVHEWEFILYYLEDSKKALNQGELVTPSLERTRTPSENTAFLWRYPGYLYGSAQAYTSFR